MTWLNDFGRGFKKGFGTTLQVGGHLLPGIGGGVSAMGKEIKNLHKGGRVPKNRQLPPTTGRGRDEQDATGTLAQSEDCKDPTEDCE